MFASENLLNLALSNLFSPMILFFAFGLLASWAKTDLEVPEAMSTAMAIFLLVAIGLKGGSEVAVAGVGQVWPVALAAICLGAVIPIIAFVVLTKVGRLDVINAAAVAGHYGSVSAVTFITGMSFLNLMGVPFEGYMVALLAMMESPAIIIAIVLARLAQARAGVVPAREKFSSGKLLREAFLGKSVLLLAGGLVIGYITGPKGMEQVVPFFDGMFRGVLTLFMLDMGLLAGRRLTDLKSAGLFLGAFGMLMPLLNAGLGLILGAAVGLSLGGATLLTILAASSSYIAAPAAMRMALPAANPSLYLGASLGITFPFNIMVGIPLYYYLATLIYG